MRFEDFEMLLQISEKIQQKDLSNRFGKRDYEESDPTELLYEDMYFDKRAPMRFGKRADDYFY